MTRNLKNCDFNYHWVMLKDDIKNREGFLGYVIKFSFDSSALVDGRNATKFGWRRVSALLHKTPQKKS